MSKKLSNSNNLESPITRTRTLDSYYTAFLIVLVICLSPSKIIAYAAPLVAMAWLFFRSGNHQVRIRVYVMLISVPALLGFYLFVNSQFVLVGGVLAVITYSSFILLAVIPASSIAGPKLFDRITSLVIKVVLIEALWGILQAIIAAIQSGSFDVGNGDAVEGTIHLGFAPDEGLGNPMFAANLCFLLLALLPAVAVKRRSAYIAFVFGAITFVLASVMHMIIFLILAMICSYLFFDPPLPGKVGGGRFVLALLLIPIFTGIALAGNLRSIPDLVAAFKSGDNPKAQILNRALFEMPHEYPAMPVVGLGPGQFSSRAALISTGLYFGGITNPRSLPFLRDQISAPLASYLVDLWIASSDEAAYGNSSTAKPFFSWLSVYTELGAPAFLGLMIYCLVLLRRMKGRAHTPQQKWLALSAGAGIIFFLLLGFEENYWEVPQALLVGLMLLQLMYANVVYARPPEVNR